HRPCAGRTRPRFRYNARYVPPPSESRIATVRSSIQPSSRSRCTKPAIHWPWVEGVPPPMTPIIGSFDGCCARAASGHAAATPPSSVMNSSLQDGAESAMSIRIGYLLPTRERIMAGQLQAAPLLELAERAERVSVPPRYPAAPA